LGEVKINSPTSFEPQVNLSTNAMLTNSPRISVLMTIYNAQPYLQAAIESLINQSFKDWELIAVENGSKDNSLEVLSSYADDRIIIHKFDENIGRTPALRYAFEHAKGEYIAVLDADDLADSERFARQVAFLDEKPEVAVVATWAYYIDRNGKRIGEFTPDTNQEELADSLGWSNPIAHSSAMYRREAAAEIGGYPENYVWAQDYALFIALTSKYRIAMLDHFLCSIRIQETNMTRSPKLQLTVAQERLLLLEQAAQLIPLSAKGKRLNRGARILAQIRIALIYCSEKKIAAAFNIFVKNIINAGYLCAFVVFKLTSGRISRIY
jgi:glycosyltransferase involved in cell wall biosynthesis